MTVSERAPVAPQMLRDAAVDAVADAKGVEIKVLDVTSMTDVTDYMIVASGTSQRHVSAVADRVVDRLRGLGVRALGVEGREEGEWVLLDFGDVVVHVMRPETRAFYDLERLWSFPAGREQGKR